MRAKSKVWMVGLILMATTSIYGGGDAVIYEDPDIKDSGTTSRNGPFVGFEGSYVLDIQSVTSYIGEYPLYG